jgi:hypothetical protein
MDTIDKIYVLVHPVYEKDRLNRIRKHILEVGLPAEKIVLAASCWGSELSSKTIFSVWDPFIRRGIPNLTWKSRCLSKGEISLVLNFYSAAMDAVKHGYKNVLIFESDVYLRSDFMSRFADLMADLKNREWDYVSLGEGVNTRPEGSSSSYWAPTKAYTAPHQYVFRCTDSMLLSGRFLEKVTQTILPFRECLDWELNYQMAIHRGIPLWADPPLAEQGTCYSRLVTSLPA